MRVPLQIVTAEAADVSEERGEDDDLSGSLLDLDIRASLDILLVDDNPTNLLVGGGLLRAAGHRVTEAENGREALEVVQGRKFDLILMDISMPQIDGVQATRIIRGTAGPNRNTPIVAVTAHAMPAERRRLLQAGMQACMIKPFRVSDLEELFRKAKRDSRAAMKSEAADEEHEENGDIDWSVVKSLEETLSPDLLTSTLIKICAEIEREVALISDLTKSSPREIAERAHKLAGTTALAGAARLTAGLRLVETAQGMRTRKNFRRH